MNKLVSIVSPVYNGENYIARFLDSIIEQSYRPLELILVNDGSTDKTDEIVSSYKDLLEKKEVSLKYIVKENGGLGSAVDTGLKYITGDYLTWPDTDDYLLPNSIKCRVDFLEKHSEFGFVYAKGKSFYEDVNQFKENITNSIPKDGWIFENVITGNIVLNPCGYMLRTEAFLDVNPKKTIFPSRYGQNIQMLLPISKKYKCGKVEDMTYVRVIRNNSLSKSLSSENDTAWINANVGVKKIYNETLNSIGDDALAYLPYIEYRNLRVLTALSKKYGKKKEYKKVLLKAILLLIQEQIKIVFDLFR